MTEITWFMFAFWIISIVLGWRMREHSMMLFGMSSVIGVILALSLFAESAIIGFVIIIFSLYLMYIAIFQNSK